MSGLFVGAQWQPESGPAWIAGAFVLAMTLAAHGGELEAGLWRLVLACLALGCGLGVARAAPVHCAPGGEAELGARVESVRHGRTDARIRFRVIDGRWTQGGAGLPAGLRAQATMRGDEAPPPSSTVTLRTTLRPSTTLQNPSPHPAIGSANAWGCWAKLVDPEAITIIRTPPVTAAIDAARATVRGHMNRALAPEVAGVARALVLGDGGALPYEQRKTIAAVGLAHLFAVSGLHIALVSGTLVRLLQWLARGWVVAFDPRRVAAGLGVPLTLFHAFFAGGSPSAWRAAITAAITWSLVVLGRRPSAVAITAGAALILSAPNPAMALRPAFLLSIVATSAILSAPRTARSERWRWLRGAATISARTLVATTPMVWWWFGGVPLIGWVTNIVVLPFGSWVVIPLAHAFALTIWYPAAADAVGRTLSLAVHALLHICEAFAPLAVTRQLPTLDVRQGLIVLAACVLLLITARWRSRAGVLAAAALAWMAAERALVAREQPRGIVRVSFVDVGQGDSSLVDLPDGRLLMIDTGQGGRHPAVREVRRLLAARRRSQIDILVITHGHPDHYGGLANLLDEVDIGEIWLNGQLLGEERDGAMERLLNSALVRGARLRFAPELCESAHAFGEARIEVLWPCPRYDPTLDLNDNSLLLRLSLGRRSFLFTGDLEAEAEARLVKSGRIANVDVLKVAHHGSRTSTTAPLVDAARPSLAVVSSGSGNRYGHPSPRVLRRLLGAGARIHRTDIQGGLIVSTEGERLDFER